MRACSIGICLLLIGSAPLHVSSLREAAEQSHIVIGAAVRPAHLEEQDYTATLVREFNVVEAEDAMKWEALRPDAETFDFSEADRLVDFATRHSMKVRGHTLVWHKQNPPWLTEGNFSPEQLRSILERHIRTVVGHYRGKIFAWDVVNEAFDEQVIGKMRPSIWYDMPGITRSAGGLSYIQDCFRWAHEADPNSLLFYNEAEAEGMNAKADEVYAMAQSFVRLHVPMDGIGLQMHVSNLHPDIAGISENIRRLTALGLQVHITELDVALPIDSTGSAQPEDLRLQAEVYRNITAACLSHPGCTAIQTWGFTDKYSWIGSHSKGRKGAALLFDSDYRPKPAYEAVLRALERK